MPQASSGIEPEDLCIFMECLRSAGLSSTVVGKGEALLRRDMKPASGNERTVSVLQGIADADSPGLKGTVKRLEAFAKVQEAEAQEACRQVHPHVSHVSRITPARLGLPAAS
jgi:hypothetical protein